MEKVKAYFKNYFNKSSWFKLITDFLFYLFILLMIIPSTRGQLSEILIKTTLRSPKVRTENPAQSLNNEDYHLLIEDMNGNPSHIGDFQGKVILINFWATWCPPCRAEMSSFQELFDEYGTKMNFLFMAEDDEEKVKKYISEFKYNLPVYFLRSLRSQNFTINSLPTTYILNKKGEFVLNKKGAADWNSSTFKEKLDVLIDE